MKKLIKSLVVLTLSFFSFIIIGCETTHTHKWENEVITKEVTCSENGEKTLKCNECGEVKVEIIEALGHLEVIDEGVNPTCTSTGLTEGKHCERCAEVLVPQEEVAALGHDEVIDEKVDPTCESTGLTEGSHCARCSEVLVPQEKVVALGHNYESVVTEPTCVEQGYTTHTCSRCDDSYVDSYVEALGHIEVVDKAVEPTCTDTGLIEGSHCDRCNVVLVAQNVIPALGHDEVTDEKVEPTCTEKGLTEGKHCDRCKEVLIAQEEVAALGHVKVVDKAVEPTCTKTGLTEGSHCDRCKEVLVAQEEVAVLGHDYKLVVTEPTCVEQGYTTHTCSRCDDTYIDSYVDALGHSFGDWIVTVEPGCESTGIKLRDCEACNHFEEEEIAALGHNKVIDEAKDPTCETLGLTEGSHCDRCKEVYVEQEIITYIDHNYVDLVCTNCGCTDGLTYTLSLDEQSYCVSNVGDAYYQSYIKIPLIHNGLPVTTIKDSAFYECINLIYIDIPESIEIIEAFAFDRCSSLKELYIPSSVRYIGRSAFDACTSIEKIVVNENNKIYDSRNNCNAIIETATNTLISGCLTTVIPEEIETIWIAAFASKNISSIIIPSNVKHIEAFAFYACPLTDIYFKGTKEQWDNIELNYSLPGFTFDFEYCHDSILNATIHYNYEG